MTPFFVHCGDCGAKPGAMCNLCYEVDGEKPASCRSYHMKRIHAARGADPKPSKSMRDPWVVSCAEALDESILRAMSDRVPRLLSQIVPIVENDYGKIADNESSKMTQLQRRFRKLCAAGAALRIEIGKRLYAYCLPDARVANDIDSMREIIMENFDREPKPWSARAFA